MVIVLTDRFFTAFLSLNVALAAAIASTIYVAVTKLQDNFIFSIKRVYTGKIPSAQLND